MTLNRFKKFITPSQLYRGHWKDTLVSRINIPKKINIFRATNQESAKKTQKKKNQNDKDRKYYILFSSNWYY